MKNNEKMRINSGEIREKLSEYDKESHDGQSPELT
jgi:hypothetical protein